MSRFAREPTARAGLRGIDQAQALSILHALDRFGKTGAGDIGKLTGDKQGRLRIRVGNRQYCVFPPRQPESFGPSASSH